MPTMSITPRGVFILVVVPLALCCHGIITLADLASAPQYLARFVTGYFAELCVPSALAFYSAGQVLFSKSRDLAKMRRGKLTRRQMRDVCEAGLLLAFIICVSTGLRSGKLGAKMCSAGSQVWSVWSASGDWVGALLQGAFREQASTQAGGGFKASLRSGTACDYDVLGVTCTAE